MFNLAPDVMCAGLKSYSTIRKGRDLAGIRSMPLFIYRDMFKKAMALFVWNVKYAPSPGAHSAGNK